MKNRLIRIIIASLYTLLIVCMGIATIVEKFQDTSFAHEHIYGAWWFTVLWAFLVFISVVYIFMTGMGRRVPVLLLHLSFVVILAGAFVTHVFSEEGTVYLKQNECVTGFVSNKGVAVEFPFLLKLSDFNIQYYPGTDAVMDYQANVTAEHEGQTERISVSMNHIGKLSGYRFYQSSYDADLKGTILLVAHDPYGIAITYIGYLMLLISLLWTMFSRSTHIRGLYRTATRIPVVVLFMLFSASMADARPAVTAVNAEIADEMGHVAVLYNGRICPLNTVATEFVTKLCGKSTWEGMSSNEIFLSWMIFYSEWESQPIIKVKKHEVQEMLGIEDKWASVRDFYTSQHVYKLKDKVSDSSISDAKRKAIREVDEKIQVVAMFYNSEMLRVFPLSTKGKLEWYIPGSTELPRDIPEAEFQFINHAMDYLVKSILADDVAGAKRMIAKLKLYQREKAGDVLPSPVSIKSEILYNSLQSMRWIVFLSLTLSILFCIYFFMGKENLWTDRLHSGFHILLAAFLTVLLALRWYVCGHVPLSNGFETMLFMSWATLLVSYMMAMQIPVLKVMGTLVASLCMLVAMIAMGSPQITQLMPVLQSPLLSIHVAVIMSSYVLFSLMVIVAVRCLFLSEGDMLTRLTALSRLLLYPAVALLAIGIFVGAVWANVSWGTYWSWDPKETWALITLMVYAIPLHRTPVTCPARPRRYHIYIFTAFLAVIITYFGVNYFMTGMHSYA